MHKEFVENVKSIVSKDEIAIGLAIGGSWITNEIDEFSDLDFIIVTENKIAPDKEKMISYAKQFGDLLNAFTGEHVGESRLLVCLYDNPLIHVDYKFITPDELKVRVENPTILWERDSTLSDIIKNTEFKFPLPDYQWIEDRFWVWIHYLATKIGRGEFFETLDGINFLRTTVIAPLLQIKNGNLPKGFRKAENNLLKDDLIKLEKTVAAYDKESMIKSIYETIGLYNDLREKIFDSSIKLQTRTEKRSLEYLDKIVNQKQLSFRKFRKKLSGI